MEPGRHVAVARRRAGLTQRALAARARVPQSTVGRIEAGLIDPRARTLESLLRACGYEFELHPVLGQGVDRSQIRERLALSPTLRIEEAVRASRAISRIRGRSRAGSR